MSSLSLVPMILGEYEKGLNEYTTNSMSLFS